MKIDRLILDDSLSPEGFGESMRLLKLYLESQTEVSPLEAYEELGLSEDVSEGGKTYHGDEWLLYKGLTLLEKIQKEIEDLANHKDRLEKLIEKGGVGGQRTEDELRAIIESVSVSNVSDEENPVLLDCYQAWVDGDRTASMNRAVGLFVKFVCETKSRGVRLYEVTPADVREYQKFSIALPKGVVVGERSIEELSKIGGSQRSPKTLQDEFSYVATFLRWCMSQGYLVEQRLFSVLSKGSGLEVKAKDKKTRLPYSDEDLSALFNSAYYRNPSSFRTSAMYWGPILAIFTGARMSEILSLEKHNIKRADGIWYIDFVEYDPDSCDEYKRLKAAGSKRTVPLHSQLIKLGFIDFVNASVGRLFPDEKRNSHGKFDAFQKRQRRVRDKVGIGPPNSASLKDFHSFRHTVRTRLSELRTEGAYHTHFNDGIIDAIVGHESLERSIGQKVYTHSDSLKAKSRALEKLSYTFIDWESVPSWTIAKFSRELRKSGHLKA